MSGELANGRVRVNRAGGTSGESIFNLESISLLHADGNYTTNKPSKVTARGPPMRASNCDERQTTK